MVDKFDTIVDIKVDPKNNTIFGLKAQPPIASILSFAGYRHEITPKLQTISHSTRAYISNAKGLPGILQASTSEILRQADLLGCKLLK